MSSLNDDCVWCPIVAVPARNEAQRLPSLIAALGQQTWLAERSRRLRVVIVLNNCDDASAAVVSAAAAFYPGLLLNIIETKFSASEAHVGSARRLAMQSTWELRPDPSHSVIFTTDADAVPMSNWIENTLQAIEAGADLVGGQIFGDEIEESRLGPQFVRRARFQLRYTQLIDRLAAVIDPLPHDPWPRHSDHTGASLAVRADVFAAVGGMPPLPSREDLAFVSSVRAAGYRLRHSPDVRVRVSARLKGRARDGMADCIKGWLSAAMQDLPHLVEDPVSVVRRLRKRRTCREIALVGHTRKGGFDLVSSPPRHGDGLPIGPALIELVAPDEPDACVSVPVKAAIRQILQIIAETEGEIGVL